MPFWRTSLAPDSSATQRNATRQWYQKKKRLTSFSHACRHCFFPFPEGLPGRHFKFLCVEKERERGNRSRSLTFHRPRIRLNGSVRSPFFPFWAAKLFEKPKRFSDAGAWMQIVEKAITLPLGKRGFRWTGRTKLSNTRLLYFCASSSRNDRSMLGLRIVNLNLKRECK